MRASASNPAVAARAPAESAAALAALLLLACGGDGVPVVAPGDDTGSPAAWATVAAGDGYSCATAGDGRAFCWGSRRTGRLGDSGTEGIADRPVRVEAESRSDLRLDTVAAGSDHACGLAGDGAALCWGRNDAGQLGSASTGRCPTGRGRIDCSPRAVRAAAPLRFRALTVGGTHSCGVTLDDVLVCWGSNDAGQLGIGGFGGGGPQPRGVLRAAAGVAAGALHTCVLTLGTEVICWGANGDGQLGDRTFFPRTVPTAVTIRGARAVVAGARHSCVLAPAHCWGRGTEGQIDGGSARTAPFPLRVVTDRSFELLAAGARHTCGIAGADEALCWGAGEDGALGTGGTPEILVSPTPVAGGRDWRALSAGAGHTCGVDVDGDLWCWGANGRGQVGDGTRQDRPAPTPVGEPPG